MYSKYIFFFTYLISINYFIPINFLIDDIPDISFLFSTTSLFFSLLFFFFSNNFSFLFSLFYLFFFFLSANYFFLFSTIFLSFLYNVTFLFSFIKIFPPMQQITINWDSITGLKPPRKNFTFVQTQNIVTPPGNYSPYISGTIILNYNLNATRSFLGKAVAPILHEDKVHRFQLRVLMMFDNCKIGKIG